MYIKSELTKVFNERNNLKSQSANRKHIKTLTDVRRNSWRNRSSHVWKISCSLSAHISWTTTDGFEAIAYPQEQLEHLFQSLHRSNRGPISPGKVVTMTFSSLWMIMREDDVSIVSYQVKEVSKNNHWSSSTFSDGWIHSDKFVNVIYRSLCPDVVLDKSGLSVVSYLYNLRIVMKCRHEDHTSFFPWYERYQRRIALKCTNAWEEFL